MQLFTTVNTVEYEYLQFFYIKNIPIKGLDDIVEWTDVLA